MCKTVRPAHDGDAIGEIEHLVEPAADVHDGAPGSPQSQERRRSASASTGVRTAVGSSNSSTRASCASA